SRDLAQHLNRINNQNYAKYQELLNCEYPFRDFTLIFQKVQKDPYASASHIRVLVKDTITNFPQDCYSSTDRRIALCDYLTRQVVKQIHASKMDRQFQSTGWHGVKGGNFEMTQPGQQVLDRTSIILFQGNIEARFTFNLPAQGRTIASERAIEVLTKQLPMIVHHSLKFASLNQQDMKEFIQCYEDQQWLRNQLSSKEIIAFIPDKAILPRESGVSDKPLQDINAVKFKSPESLKIEFKCPSGKQLTGMGIRQGITMIAGGGYHGKSTLLEGIEQGIYNHIPGDGREYLVCDPTLCKVRSEDGRNIEGTDISAYIDNLPFNANTRSFSSRDASGSTSMAAGIQELVEIGSKTLIYDEDTCATNFMIRDQRMQRIIQKENEPITPLIYKIRSLYEEMGVSSILVIGGCGDYVDVSDCIIEMRDYIPRDITQFAKDIASQYPSDLRQEGGERYGSIAHRKLIMPSYTLEGRSNIPRLSTIIFDKDKELTLSAVTSLVERGQTQWIASAIKYFSKNDNIKRMGLKDALNNLDQILQGEPTATTTSSSFQLLTSPMDLTDPGYVHGENVRPTIFQLAQAINRLRGIRITQ
ncbi:hypothetical protein INT45_001849, partial [Circinella minor]